MAYLSLFHRTTIQNGQRSVEKLQHLTRFADPDHVEYFNFSCLLNHFGGQRMSVDEEKSQNHQTAPIGMKMENLQNSKYKENNSNNNTLEYNGIKSKWQD